MVRSLTATSFLLLIHLPATVLAQVPPAAEMMEKKPQGTERELLLAELARLPPSPPPDEALLPTALKMSVAEATAGKPFEIIFSVTNPTDHQVAINPNRRNHENEWTMNGVAYQFSTPEQKGGMTFGPSSHPNPPSMDLLQPGGTKVIRLTWTPVPGHLGAGTLSITLPPVFKPLAGIPVVVRE